VTTFVRAGDEVHNLNIRDELSGCLVRDIARWEMGLEERCFLRESRRHSEYGLLRNYAFHHESHLKSPTIRHVLVLKEVSVYANEFSCVQAVFSPSRI
jgi:hypothetical protein